MAVAWSDEVGRGDDGDDLGRIWRTAWAEAQRYDGLVGWARLNEVAARLGVTRIARPLPRGAPCVVQAVKDEPFIALAEWLVKTELQASFYWHALGHVWLRHAGARVCYQAPLHAACQATWFAGLALSVPPALAGRGHLVIARQTGLPVELVSLWSVVGRRYGTLPGHVSPDEVADTLLAALRWTREQLDAAACAGRGR